MWLRFDLLRLEIKFPEITDDVLLKCEYDSAQQVYCAKSLLRINFFLAILILGSINYFKSEKHET